MKRITALDFLMDSELYLLLTPYLFTSLLMACGIWKGQQGSLRERPRVSFPSTNVINQWVPFADGVEAVRSASTAFLETVGTVFVWRKKRPSQSTVSTCDSVRLIVLFSGICKFYDGTRDFWKYSEGKRLETCKFDQKTQLLKYFQLITSRQFHYPKALYCIQKSCWVIWYVLVIFTHLKCLWTKLLNYL